MNCVTRNYAGYCVEKFTSILVHDCKRLNSLGGEGADLHITFHEIQGRHSHVRETTAQDTTNGTSTIVLLGVQLDFLF